MSISVIIRTYTEARWNYLLAAVESVQAQSVPPSEIILVVDHNPDLLAKVRARFSDAIVIESKKRGSSGAWNSGIAAANHEVVAFLDDDAVAESDWLEHLNRHYDDPRVVGVGGAIEPVWVNGRPSWFPEEFQWVVGCTYRGMPETVAPVRNLIGCNMSFRREVFEEIGEFREDLGHQGKRPIGNDETELCIRVHQQWPNKVILHEPKARVSHMVPSTRSSWSYFRSRCYLEGQSKAKLSKLVGRDDGLSSERAYTFKTLPQGIMRGIAGGVRHRDLGGFWRAGAIVVGLAITMAGYLKGIVSQKIAHRCGSSTIPQSPTG